ncbi:MAG: SCO1664 family protein [Actinomycetota bacterium]|nr:SCO1664 family protein [Actinomycetota bacterium]
MSEAAAARRGDVEVLSAGSLRLLGLMPGASNFTYLAEVRAGGRGVRAVYKPRRGEAPLWDFPDGTLCNREVAAFLLAEALGWPAVPPTVLRDGPHGRGAVQLFVDADPGAHYFTMREERADEFRRVAAFDVVANNADRKAGHCLLGAGGRIWQIDHGLCFGAAYKLRTVIWEFAGEPLPAGLAGDLERTAGSLRGGPLRASMLGLLSAEEVDATAGRAEALAEAGAFPHPGPGRPYPWPQI